MTREKIVGLLYEGYIDDEYNAKDCYHKANINQRHENYYAEDVWADKGNNYSKLSCIYYYLYLRYGSMNARNFNSDIAHKVLKILRNAENALY